MFERKDQRKVAECLYTPWRCRTTRGHSVNPETSRVAIARRLNLRRIQTKFCRTRYVTLITVSAWRRSVVLARNNNRGRQLISTFAARGRSLHPQHRLVIAGFLICLFCTNLVPHCG